MDSKNFKYLDDLIHSGANEIVLDSDIVLTDGEESEYEDGIKLDVDDLTINGNGHTIDAQGKTRLFDCTGKNITIKNIILKNAYSQRDGGAIYNRGELTIAESILTKNEVFDNESDSSEFPLGYGGVIYNDEGELTITDSTLNENRAARGGAIYNKCGELTITESTLNNNSAGYGGAIYNDEGELTITDSTLRRNETSQGGALFNYGGEIVIYESLFIENLAMGGIFSAFGGAIYDYGGQLTITDSALKRNMAYGKYGKGGGAISLSKSTKYESENCTFEDNRPDDVYEEM